MKVECVIGWFLLCKRSRTSDSVTEGRLSVGISKLCTFHHTLVFSLIVHAVRLTRPLTEFPKVMSSKLGTSCLLTRVSKPPLAVDSVAEAKMWNLAATSGMQLPTAAALPWAS